MLYDLARFVQQCGAWTCALVRFSTRNMSQHVATGWPIAWNMLHAPNSVSICYVQMLRSFGRSLQTLGQQCWDVLLWDVAIVWPGLNRFYIPKSPYLGAPENPNLFQFPWKVWVIRGRLYVSWKKTNLLPTSWYGWALGASSFSRRDFLKSDCTVSQANKNCSILITMSQTHFVVRLQL